MKQILLLTLFLSHQASAVEADYILMIKDHHFQPTEINIPAGKKVKILIQNMDATPEEFDSYSLNREKIVAGNSSAIIFIGPLTPERYPFTGEFHNTTAFGAIIAK